MRTPISMPMERAWEGDDEIDSDGGGYIDIQAVPTDSYVQCGSDAPEYAIPSPVRLDEYVDVRQSEPEYAEVMDDEGSAVSMYGDVAAAADGDAAVDASSAVARKPGMLASLPGRGQVHVASAAGDLHRLKALVGEGASVNTEDKNGRTPLMYALRFDELRTAAWLVANGATVDHQTKDRSTALHYACFQGTSETVQFLTKTANANHRLVDNEGRTPLHWSMHNCSVKIFDALVANTDLNEADLNTRDSSGMTAVMWACCYDATEHLDRLLALGADLHLVDVDGKSAMHWSVRTRRTKCLKRLLSYQNSFDMDAQGRSIIHHAAEIGNVRAIKLIATKRPQAIHDVDDNGRSPLHWAAVCRHTAVLRLLVKLGAYVSRKDVKGKTALQYTIDHEFPEGEEILRAEKFTADKPRLGPADASTSLRAFDMPVPAGFVTPSIDARRLFKMLRVGTYLSKCTNEGKGVLHRRYFWLDCFTGELCWCKSPESFARKPGSASSEYIVDVADGPSDRIRARADFDGAGAHKWALTLHTNSRMIDVVARDVTNPDGTVTPAEQIYRTWIDGLRCLKVYGEHILQAQTEELTLSDSDSDFDADDVDATIASMPAAEDM